LHYHCCRKYRSRNGKCPACSQDWPQDFKSMNPVGEDAIKDGQDEGGRTRRKSIADDSDEEDEDGDGDDGDEEPIRATQTQSQRKGKGKKKTAPTNMEVDEDDEDEYEAPQQTQVNGRRRSTRAR